MLACITRNSPLSVQEGSMLSPPTLPPEGCDSHAKTKKPPLFITRNSNKKDIKCKYRYRPLTIFVLRVIQFGIYSTTAITKDTLRIPYLRQIYSNTPHCWHCRRSWTPPSPGSFKAFSAIPPFNASLLLGSVGLEKQTLLWSDTQLSCRGQASP